MNVGAGSYLEVNIPMTVGENGVCVYYYIELISSSKVAFHSSLANCIVETKPMLCVLRIGCFLLFSVSLSHSLSLPSGYSLTIKGQLLHVDTTSSMQYRTLLEAEMLAVSSIQKLSS